MSKIMTVIINGNEHTLDVGKGWFTEYYEEAQQVKDPLLKSNLAFILNLVYAGARCHAKVNKLPFNLTKEELAEWAGGLEVEEIERISNEYVKLSGVGEALTQEPKS